MADVRMYVCTHNMCKIIIITCSRHVLFFKDGHPRKWLCLWNFTCIGVPERAFVMVSRTCRFSDKITNFPAHLRNSARTTQYVV